MSRCSLRLFHVHLRSFRGNPLWKNQRPIARLQTAPVNVLVVAGRGAEALGREEFQRNDTFELRIFGLVDDTHPSFPEFLEDLVMRDGLANQKHTPLTSSGN